MTIIVACKVSDGMVLAADSRVTIVADQAPVYVSDNDVKLLEIVGLPIGVLTCGTRSVRGRTIASWLEDFSRIRPRDTCKVIEVAEALALYLRQADSGSITLLIAGFDPEAQSGADGRIFTVVIDVMAPPQVRDDSGFYYRLDGDFDAVTRLIEGRSYRYHQALREQGALDLAIAIDEAGTAKTPIPLYAMSLQDGVELAEFWVKTQIAYQKFSSHLQTCGGAVDSAVLTPGRFRWVQRKPFFAD